MDFILGLLGGGSSGLIGLLVAVGGVILAIFGLKAKGGQEARRKLERQEDKRVDRALDARQDIDNRVEEHYSPEGKGETYVEQDPRTGTDVQYVDPDDSMRNKWSRD